MPIPKPPIDPSNPLKEILDKLSIPPLELASCPKDLQVLKDLIKVRNSIVKELNNIQKGIDFAIQGLTISNGLITTIKTVYDILKNLPIPTSTGAPGSPGLPISTINTIQDKKQELINPSKTGVVDKIQKTSTAILSVLVGVNVKLQLVLGLLSIIDKLVKKCVEESDDPELVLESINDELRALNDEQSSSNLDSSPIEVNGFIFNIETETTTNNLKRKRAIAKNKQGVILLRGEYSFSSIDQILIDELIFYVQTNNLKAD